MYPTIKSVLPTGAGLEHPTPCGAGTGPRGSGRGIGRATLVARREEGGSHESRRRSVREGPLGGGGLPKPEPGPNQVLIRIGASGLCFTDVHISEGAIATQAAKGRVKVMAEICPLADIAQAYERVAEGKVRFRAVITP